MTTPAHAPAPRAAAAPPRAPAVSPARPRAGGGDGGGTWDDPDRVERLKALWAQTDPVLSAGEIGRRLGGLRKNQVIGKVHRLGLPARDSPLRGGPWGHRPPTAADSPFVGKRRRAGRRAAGRPAEPDALPPRERPAPVALTTFAAEDRAAEDGGGAAPPEPPPAPRPPPSPPPGGALPAAAASCRWPFGDPKRAGFRFCGAPDVAPGRPYCTAHCAEAYVPAERRAAHLRAEAARAFAERPRGGRGGGR